MNNQLNQNDSKKRIKSQAEVLSVFIILFFIATIIFSIILASMSKGREMLIFALCSGLLFLLFLLFQIMITIRLCKIDLTLDQQENADCFQSGSTLLQSIIMNDDYQLWRWILMFGTYFQFLISAERSRRQELLNSDLTMTTQNGIIVLYIFNILISIQIIIGILLNAYILYQLVVMLSDYNQFEHELVYSVHLQEQFLDDKQQKLNTFNISIFYTIGLLIHYILKAILLFNYNNQYSIMIGVMCIIYFLFFSFVFYLLLEQRKILLNQNFSQSLNDPNSDCFAGWFTLLKSFLRSQKLKWYSVSCFTLLIIQSLFIGAELPFYEFFDIIRPTAYSINSFIFFDTVATQVFLIKILISSMARLLFNYNTEPPVYTFLDQEQPQIYPTNNQDEENGQLYNQNVQQQQQQQQFGECCFCLDQMTANQRLKKLPCHPSHIFHYNCITKWLVNHRTCPLCQKQAN